MVQLGEHFASKDSGSHAEQLRQQRWFIKAREDHQRREKTQDRLDDDFAALASDVIMATSAQIAAFEVKLDTYDEATVRALMDNQDLLDAINARMDAMLDQAHVMEDGRRVFRTQDGQQVFDETGTQVAATEIDPQIIPSTAPTWEAYAPLLEEHNRLEVERAEILEYQEQLDVAREQIAEGEISEADLEAMDANLMQIMPEAVQANVPGMDVAEPEPERAPEVQPVAAAPPQVQQVVGVAAGPGAFQ